MATSGCDPGPETVLVAEISGCDVDARLSSTTGGITTKSGLSSSIGTILPESGTMEERGDRDADVGLSASCEVGVDAIALPTRGGSVELSISTANGGGGVLLFGAIVARDSVPLG